VPATRKPVGLFRFDGKRPDGSTMGQRQTVGIGMSLSLTLMQTPTSIALQSLPEQYCLSLKLRVRGMLRPLS